MPTASNKPTESERTAIFTTAAQKTLLRKPTEITKHYYRNLKTGIGKAILSFYEATQSCPESLEISELRFIRDENLILVTILVHGKKDQNDYTKKYVVRWTGVRFNSEKFDKITGREDVVVEIVGTGKTFQATGDFLYEHQNVYPR